MEGLAAFFLESTFLGLWIFGRDRLSPRVHLARIWLVAIGTMLSAYFILAANSWMQHPVGYEIDEPGRAEMTSIWAVLDQLHRALAFAHTILGALATAGMVIARRRAWHLRARRRRRRVRPRRCGSPLSVVLVGDGRDGDRRPLPGAADDRAAADEDGRRRGALRDAERRRRSRCSRSAPFDARPRAPDAQHQGPARRSRCWRPTRWNGEVEGINDLNARVPARSTARASTRPIVARHVLDVPRSWSAPASLMILLAAVGLLLWRRRGSPSLAALPAARRCWAVALPFVANAAGWIFTEMGRQPWVVQGLLRTDDAVSPTVSAARS